MVSAHPIAILEGLMAGGPAGGAECTLLLSQDFWDVHEQEKIELTTRQFVADYEGVRARIAESWGPADFAGEWDDEGFPEWSDATLLACWRRGAVTAYVEFRHDDKELPMRVVLGVRY